MRKLIIIILLFFLSRDRVDGQINIYLKDYQIYFTPKKCKDSIIKYLKDSSFIKIRLENCKGKMTVSQFDRDGALIAEGQYIESLDTLKEYVDVYDFFGEIIKIKVQKYFQPLRNGIWIFYENRKITKRVKYEKGIIKPDQFP